MLSSLQAPRVSVWTPGLDNWQWGSGHGVISQHWCCDFPGTLLLVMKNGYFHPINYLGDRTGSNYKIIEVPACVIKFHTTKLRAHGFSQLPSPAATSGLICSGTFYWSVSAVCGKDLIWWWPNTDQDGLPQRGPEEHAVWKLSGDVLIMRAILVGFNYVNSGAGGDAVPPQPVGSSKRGAQ